jgi:protein-tyrosine phosphatase
VSVLVVCTANVARSPLGAAMLATSLRGHGIAVASAGTHARQGVPAARQSCELAELRGLDLADHRARPVTPPLIAQAALVVTMSERHRDVAAPLAAGAGARTFTVRELVRLLETVDTAAAPDDPMLRLSWLAAAATQARPSARPARGPEDVRDPIRDPWPAWVQMGATLDHLMGRLVHALGATPGWQPAPTSAEPSALETARAEGAARTAGRPRRRWRRHVR